MALPNRVLKRSLVVSWIAVSIVGLAVPCQAAPMRRFVCPSEVEPLVTRMVRDLPAYANRILVRSRGRTSVRNLSSVTTAGRPEFEPLPLGPDAAPDRKPDPMLKQAFITTLERESLSGKFADLQQFHWLFLTRTQTGWQLALMFTRTGTYPTKQPPTPPRESSQGVIGQAIRIWLRDCNAGAVRL